MNAPIIDGITPINPMQPRDARDLSLSPFQRLDAQVLSIDGTTATLRVDGVTFTAQLANQQDAASLQNQNNATFIVSQTGQQNLTLKLAPQNNPAQTTQSTQPLASQLLAQQNLPVNAQNLLLAEAVLNQRLPITDGLLNELLTALNAQGRWGQAEAELAAALKAGDYPVSAESLTLAAPRSERPLQDLLTQLATASGNFSPDLQKLIRETVQTLENLLLDASLTPEALAASLKEATAFKGRSLENLLLAKSDAGMLALVQLQQGLANAGQTELAKSIQQFIDDLRHEQFFNIQRNATQPQGTWAEIGFQLDDEEMGAVRLRIKREDETSTVSDSNRLVLQVEVAEGEFIEVDLALAGKNIRTKLSAEDASWCDIAERDLILLDTALLSLGYQPETQVSQNEVKPFERLSSQPVNAPVMRVNIEI